MRARGKRIGTALLVAATFAALIGIGFAGLSILVNQAQRGGINPEESSSSSAGLGLTLSLTAQPENENGVSICVTLFNMRDSTNVLTNPGLPPLPLGPCGGSTLWPFGFEILQGDYGADNLSQGKYAEIWQSIPYCSDGIPPRSYSFAPLSDNMTAFLSYPAGGPPGSAAVQRNSTQSAVAEWNGVCFGTWTGDELTPFPPGVYTVVAQDSWGQKVLVHFELEG